MGYGPSCLLKLLTHLVYGIGIYKVHTEWRGTFAKIAKISLASRIYQLEQF